MLTDAEIYKLYSHFINPSYPSFLKKFGLDHAAAKAEGVTITDSQGKTYIDCVGGYGMFNVGHNHPQVTKALQDQLDQNQLFSKPFISEIHVRLAESLSEITSDELTCSFLCNSGSEAIDNALKLARLCKGRKQIIAAENSFHGYTFGALSASGIPSFKRMFEPLVPDIIHIPYGEIKTLKDTISDKTAAVLLEPVQHEAGIVLPPEGYFQEVRKICDDTGAIFILDEIKTGFGKTGKMFAYEHYGISPDVLVLGKSIGGGLVPAGALVADKKLWKRFGLSFPMSASSYAGNVLACRAALATIDILNGSNLINECIEKGRIMLSELTAIVKTYPTLLKSVRGLGLLIGIHVVNSPTNVMLAKEIIKAGAIAMPAFANPSVLMIEPPLVISFEEIDKVINIIKTACKRLIDDE